MIRKHSFHGVWRSFSYLLYGLGCMGSLACGGDSNVCMSTGAGIEGHCFGV